MTIERSKRAIWRRKIYFVLLTLVSILLALAALLAPLLAASLAPAPQPGQVAQSDYRAIQTSTFTSDVLTQQRRDTAENAVQPIFSPANTSIGRQQLEQLRSALDYVTSVRADLYATNQQKMDDLAAMDDIELRQETISSILSLSDTRWQTVQPESLVVLERLMSDPIRPENVESVRNRAGNLVSLSLPEAQASIVAELAAAFIAPNSEFSQSLTDAARLAAREAVEPVQRSFVAGQTVVSQGEVLSEADVEALQKLGLIQPESNWQDLASATALVLLLSVFLGLYLRRQDAIFEGNGRSLALLVLLFLVFLLTARLVIPTHTVLPYIFPLAAYSLTVMALFGAELAMVTALPLALLTSYGMPNALDLTFYYLLGSLFGVLVLGSAQRITAFFRAGATIVISSSIVVLVFRLASTDPVGLATLGGAAAFNGLASAGLAVLLQFFLAQFLGMVSPMQLMELTRPDHMLLKRLLNEAPGTYQHSLQLANLGEQAAERVGADPLLTRVGALYHDLGKIINPVFFIENQAPGFTNPHDALEPLESSRIILDHVTEGLELARQHRLPRRILDFVAEHHGTMITRYQYITAVKAAGGDESRVDKEQFRYPGPRPQSRETAILMLADGSEARVRAERPASKEELADIIKDVIETRVNLGQLDDTDLTLRDLTEIHESFTATLRGIYHPRVKYPKLGAAEPLGVVEPLGAVEPLVAIEPHEAAEAQEPSEARLPSDPPGSFAPIEASEPNAPPDLQQAGELAATPEQDDPTDPPGEDPSDASTSSGQ